MLTKTKILIGIIILLVASNITTVLRFTTAENNKTTSDKKIKTEELQNKKVGRFFKDQLKMDKTQHRQFMENRRQYNQKAFLIARSIDSLRKTLIDELAKEPIDSVVIYQISQKIGKNHALLKNETAFFYLNIKKNCNDDQKEILHQIFTDLNNPETEMHFGKGRKYRRGKNPPPKFDE